MFFSSFAKFERMVSRESCRLSSLDLSSFCKDVCSFRSASSACLVDSQPCTWAWSSRSVAWMLATSSRSRVDCASAVVCSVSVSAILVMCSENSGAEIASAMRSEASWKAVACSFCCSWKASAAICMLSFSSASGLAIYVAFSEVAIFSSEFFRIKSLASSAS